jgi:pilus assembly protein CpaB
MRPKSLALLLLALGCGLVASIGVMRLMTSWKDPASDNGDNLSVLVAASDIGMGELLIARELKLEPAPTGKIPAGAITRLDDADGRRTRTKIYANEVILDNKLFSKGSAQQGATANIPPGYRLATVSVNPVTGGGSMILPGDRVDVLLQLVADCSRGIPETVTRTILQDVRVFAVNDVWSPDKDKEGNRSIVAKTISLLTTPEQGAKVAMASQMGTVNLMPRGCDDDRYAPDVQVRPSELFGAAAQSDHGSGKDSAPKSPAVKEAAPPAAETPKRPTWTVRVVKPGAVDDVVLEAASDDDSQSPTGLWKTLTTTNASTPAVEPPVKEDWKPVEPPAQTPPKIQPTQATKGDKA